MGLIDRFAELNSWSTGKKTLALLLPTCVAHSAIAPLIIYSASATGIADTTKMAWLFIAPILICALGVALALLTIILKREGRWTAYFTVFVYGGWIAVMVSSFGLWSTTLEAWVPLAVIAVSIWFDEKVGLAAFAYTVLMTILIIGLVQTNTIPYAPLLVQRDIDSQKDILWMSTILIPFFAVFLVCFAFVTLSVVVRKRQEERLKHETGLLNQAHSLIRRYAPRQVTDKIFEGKGISAFEPERSKLTIFFSDLEGFTTSTDNLDPEELANVLNQYLSEMAEIAEKYGATINQFVGDGIMLFFGAPEVTDDKDHAIRAVRMALAMKDRINSLNDTWLEHGIRVPFRARMGINTGYSSVGDFGSENRKEYTAIGVQANIAARIRDKCDPGKLLISDTTWILVKDEFECSNQGDYELAGIHFPVKIYEVLSIKGSEATQSGSGKVIPLKESTAKTRSDSTSD